MVELGNKKSLYDFQETGNTDSLMKFIGASGRDEQRYRKAVEALAPVFELLSFGERPVYENLDRGVLQSKKTEIIDIIKWMADSNKADFKTAAIELMGFIGWEEFIPCLKESLYSKLKWEQISAIRSLGNMSSKQAINTLCTLDRNLDPEIQNELEQVLHGRKSAKHGI